MTDRKSPYTSLEVAADYFDLSPRTLRREIAHGRLPAVKVGRQIRVTWADLDAWVQPVPVTHADEDGVTA